VIGRIAIGFGLALATPAMAQDEPVPVEEGLPADMSPAGPPPAAEDVEAITHDVASGLRCPVCQGLSVADSPSHTAVAMKDRVRVLVQAGYTPEQIDAYFVARYGEWVLLAPPPSGLTWGLWLAPGVLLAAGAAWAFAMTRKRAEPAPPQASAPQGRYEERLVAEAEDDA
jgi:cytochrome c-type biogenesis protein CcmH